MAAAEPGTTTSHSSSRKLGKGISLEYVFLEGRTLKVGFLAVSPVSRTVPGTW